MKKLTAGIFSILLGMVAVNSADAAVASKDYVDSKVGANTTSIETLAQTVADNKTAAEELVSDYKTENDAKVTKNTDDIATLTGLVGDNADAIAAQTQALATEKTAREDADKAISDKIGTVTEGKTVVQMISDAKAAATYNDAEVRGLISGNADAIDALETEQDTQDAAIATAQAAAETAQTQADKGVADAAAAKTAADTAQTQADKGVADAATAQAAAEAAQATANAAIPAPTNECSNPTNKCVLTYNNSAYTWEVIERGTGEVIE